MIDATQLHDDFQRRFGATPRLFRAPGRVNLIGEHTDYNAGFVMPAAIHFQTLVAIAPRSDRQLRVRSRNFNEECVVPLPTAADRPATTGGTHWMDYVCGVAWALQARGLPLTGADLLIAGDVPLGAGLSSSASLEVATALALSSLAADPPGLDEHDPRAAFCQRQRRGQPGEAAADHGDVRVPFDRAFHPAGEGRCRFVPVRSELHRRAAVTNQPARAARRDP